MSKKGTFHSPFFNNFTARIHGTPITFGFLVGTAVQDGQRAVVFAAPTPPEPEAGDAPSDIAVILKEKGSAKAFIGWAQQHCKAVRKLLPGNLEICGCFMVCSEVNAKDLAPSLSPLLKGISEPIVMTMDSRTSTNAFFMHATEGAKVVLRPTQLKPDTHKDAVLLYSATLIDFIAPRSRDPGQGDEAAYVAALSAEVEACLGKSLQQCTIGVASSDGAPLQIVNPTSEVPLSSVAAKGCTELRTAFLHGGSPVVCAPNPEGRPTFRQRCLVVASSLLLRRDGELRDAVETLRKVTVASAVERLQLGLDEAEGAKGKVALPWRALCRPEDVELPVWCGDYCMPDEAIDAAHERLGTLLGVQQSAFENAPAHLDEQALLQRHCPGTYAPEPASAKAGAGQAGASKGGLCWFCSKRAGPKND